MGKGGIIGVDNTPTTSVASGVWSMREQYNARKDSIWPVQGYRYVKWNITGAKSGSTIQASEFVLQLTGSDISMSGVTVTAPGASYPAGEEPDKLVDGTTSTKFYTASGLPREIIFDFGAGNIAVFDGYRWATANDVSNRDPDDWTISASNDNVSYTTLHTVVNASVTASRLTYVGPWSF